MEIPKLNQSPVRFESATHQYFLGDKELKGVTGTLIKRAFPDTYKKPDKYTDEQWAEILANAAAKGSNMHETIELHDELGIMSDLPELQSYIRVKKDFGLQVVATEYVVSDEENYATAIDKVLMRPDGGIILVDFKRTYDLHIDNVTLQQSICKRWFEKLNPDIKVAAIYVLWMRDDKARFEELTPWADELLDQLIEADKADTTFDIQQMYGDLPQKVYDVQQYLFNLEQEVKAKSEEMKKIKDGLCAIMLERGIKSFTTPIMSLTTITPKPRKSFDTEALKFEYPDLYEKFLKETPVKPSVRITFKGE